MENGTYPHLNFILLFTSFFCVPEWVVCLCNGLVNFPEMTNFLDSMCSWYWMEQSGASRWLHHGWHWHTKGTYSTIHFNWEAYDYEHYSSWKLKLGTHLVDKEDHWSCFPRQPLISNHCLHATIHHGTSWRDTSFKGLGQGFYGSLGTCELQMQGGSCTVQWNI